MSAQRELDVRALNEAKWAACNTRWLNGNVPSMEDASVAAENAVRAYLAAVSWTESEAVRDWKARALKAEAAKELDAQTIERWSRRALAAEAGAQRVEGS